MLISREQARRFLIHCHFDAPQGLTPIEQVEYHVRKRGSIQFDPLDVVGRNPDLVLQSRVPGYRPELLREALYERRTLVEGFDKCLCIYKVEDYPCFERMRASMCKGFMQDERIRGRFSEALAAIGERGALCSADLPFQDKVRWPWGMTQASRAVLESLWMQGRLVVHHRQGARRYYDLAERHLPARVLAAPDPHPEEAAYLQWQLLRRVNSVGLMWNRPSDAYLGMDGFKAPQRAAAFQALLQRGELVELRLEDSRHPLYCVRQALPLLCEDRPVEACMRVLGPLDNLMWDRRLVKELFGFEYRWEVYTPASQRKYGYYVLPVLVGDQLAARFEPEHYRGGELVIKRWWWEPNAPAEAMIPAVRQGLARFLGYLGAERVRLPGELAPALGGEALNLADLSN